MKCRADEAGVAEAKEELIDLGLGAGRPGWVRGQRVWEEKVVPNVMGKQGVSAGAQRALRRAERGGQALAWFGEAETVAGLAGDG